MSSTVIVLWIVSLVIMLVTIKNIIVRAVKMQRCTASVEGTITDIREKVTKKDHIVTKEYIPTVSYTVNSFEYSKKFTKVYNADTYSIGQTLEIKYNPDKPSEINKKGVSNKADIVILFIGLVIGVFGIVLLTF